MHAGKKGSTHKNSASGDSTAESCSDEVCTCMCIIKVREIINPQKFSQNKSSNCTFLFIYFYLLINKAFLNKFIIFYIF